MSTLKEKAAKVLRTVKAVGKNVTMKYSPVGVAAATYSTAKDVIKAVDSSSAAKGIGYVAERVAAGKKYEREFAAKNQQSPSTWVGKGGWDVGTGKYGHEYYGTQSNKVPYPPRDREMMETASSVLQDWSKRNPLSTARQTGAQLLREESMKKTPKEVPALVDKISNVAPKTPLQKAPGQDESMVRDAKAYMKKRGLTGDYKKYMEAAHIEVTKQQARPVKD